MTNSEILLVIKFKLDLKNRKKKKVNKNNQFNKDRRMCKMVDKEML
jgi:hypothetical protein